MPPPSRRRAAGAWLTSSLLSQAVNGGVVLTDETGEPQYTSDQARELLGGDAAFEDAWKLVARRIAEHRAEEADIGDVEDVPGASPPLHVEIPVAGAPRPARLRIVYHVLDDGGFTAVLQDRRSLEALEGALRLALRVKSLSEHMDQVAHDLKAPLNALRLNIDMLRTSLEDEGVLDIVEPRLDVLDREVARLARMVQTAMTQIRLPSEAVRSFDFRRVLREVVSLLRPLATRRGCTLELALPADRVTLVGIRDHVKQVVINLAMNGLEAMPEGGRLSLELSCAQGEAELRVIDEGAGIPPAVLARVFKLYFTTKESGSGLGLSTSRATVRRMGGSLELESREGRGTTARVRLPLQSLDQERAGGADAC